MLNSLHIHTRTALIAIQFAGETAAIDLFTYLLGNGSSCIG